MELTISVDGRHVLVVGSAPASRRVLAALRREGAVIALTDPGRPSVECLSDPSFSDPPTFDPPVSDPPVSDDAPAAGGRARPDGGGLGQTARLPSGAAEWRNLVRRFDVVVGVGLEAPLRSIVSTACRTQGTWFAPAPVAPTEAVGRVTLVGAGPGHIDLITVAGRRALAQADVVFFDRLGPTGELAEWAPGARLIDVGKTPGYHAVPQSDIERMMVDSALRGETVVRLKGGDPFVFGRGGEEVIACRRAGVDVQVVSGVSSAIAVPAAAGIPVTHRDLSRVFTVVSGHAPLADSELQHLVGLGGTVVVLMGVMTLPHLVAGLVRHGLDDCTPVAVIENGFGPSQRTTIAPLAKIAAEAARRLIHSPAVIVIGDVVGLAHNRDAESESALVHAAALITS